MSFQRCATALTVGFALTGCAGVLGIDEASRESPTPTNPADVPPAELRPEPTRGAADPCTDCARLLLAPGASSIRHLAATETHVAWTTDNGVGVCELPACTRRVEFQREESGVDSFYEGSMHLSESDLVYATGAGIRRIDLTGLGQGASPTLLTNEASGATATWGLVGPTFAFTGTWTSPRACALPGCVTMVDADRRLLPKAVIGFRHGDAVFASGNPAQLEACNPTDCSATSKLLGLSPRAKSAITAAYVDLRAIDDILIWGESATGRRATFVCDVTQCTETRRQIHDDLVRSVAVRGDDIFFATMGSGVITSCTKAGGSAPTVVASGVAWPGQMATNSRHLFVATLDGIVRIRP